MPFYRIPPNCYAIDFVYIASMFNLNVFCGYYVVSNSPNWEDFSIIPIFGVIFGHKFGILPPGCPFIGLSPIVMQLILKI